MLRSLITATRATLALLMVSANTVLHVVPLLAVAVLRALLPIARWRRLCSRLSILLAESWIATNSALIALCTRTRFEIEGLEGLDRHGWYLVLSNHQSWVDIPVLQRVCNRRIPFLKFFLKRELIWVPLLGLAWWALDFPFMRRSSREEIARNPALAGKDLEATRKACERFRELPVSVMNFVEGTRYTQAKHDEQGSAFAHLLKPRAGGSAFVLGAMGDMLQAVLDVSIAYPAGRPTLIDLCADRVPLVRVHVRRLPIPADLVGGDYENDAEYRARFQAWMNALWLEMDARLAAMLESR